MPVLWMKWFEEDQRFITAIYKSFSVARSLLHMRKGRKQLKFSNVVNGRICKDQWFTTTAYKRFRQQSLHHIWGSERSSSRLAILRIIHIYYTSLVIIDMYESCGWTRYVLIVWKVSCWQKNYLETHQKNSIVHQENVRVWCLTVVTVF